MKVHESDCGKGTLRSLLACTRGATMLSYVTTLGVVALTGAVGFAEFDDTIRDGIRSEMDAVAEANGESDGPVGSLGAEVAAASAEQLVAQGSWALAEKAGVSGVAAARKKHRGRGRVGSGNDGPGADPENGNPPNRDSDNPTRGAPPNNEPSSGGTCRNGVCSQQDGETCFAAGTPVATPSGPKPIEELAPGDLVLSRDEVTGGFSTQRISATYVTLNSPLVEVSTLSSSGDEAVVRVTAEHPFWTMTDAWVPAGELTEGDALADASGAEVTVLGVVDVAERASVYNLEVEATHTYFAGPTNVWVHNGCFGSKPQPEAGAPTPRTGAPTSSPFSGRNTSEGGQLTQFRASPAKSGPAVINETPGTHPSGKPRTDISVDPNGSPPNGYYLSWRPDGEETVTLGSEYDRFATAQLTGCAVRIYTDPNTGDVTITHYNRERPASVGENDYRSQYNDFVDGNGAPVGVNHDRDDPNVQWVLPGRDYLGTSILTGERNAAGGWDFQLRPQG